jgi:hypothetical protein
MHPEIKLRRNSFLEQLKELNLSNYNDLVEQLDYLIELELEEDNPPGIVIDNAVNILIDDNNIKFTKKKKKRLNKERRKEDILNSIIGLSFIIVMILVIIHITSNYSLNFFWYVIIFLLHWIFTVSLYIKKQKITVLIGMWIFTSILWTINLFII